MSQSIGSSIGYSRKRLKRLKRPSLSLNAPIHSTYVYVFVRIFVQLIWCCTSSVTNSGTFGSCIQTQPAGIMGQWINTWRPRDDSDAEIGLILEDDISVSPYAYRWLRAVHYAYRHRSDFAGATLQSDHVRTLSSRPIGPMAAPKSDTVFMYKALGTWGMAPKALHWRRFQVSYTFTATNRTFCYQHLFRRKCRTCTNHEVQ